ncbi:GTPase Cdc42 [Balamuthia mandrillaris]
MLEQLCNELLLKISSFLEPRDLSSLHQSSKQLSLVAADPSLWLPHLCSSSSTDDRAEGWWLVDRLAVGASVGESGEKAGREEATHSIGSTEHLGLACRKLWRQKQLKRLYSLLHEQTLGWIESQRHDTLSPQCSVCAIMVGDESAFPCAGGESEWGIDDVLPHLSWCTVDRNAKVQATGTNHSNDFGPSASTRYYPIEARQLVKMHANMKPSIRDHPLHLNIEHSLCVGKEIIRYMPLDADKLEVPNVIVLFFSVVDICTFHSLRLEAIPAVQTHFPGVPILLVGTRSDSREARGEDDTISTSRGEQLAREIGAIDYVECATKHPKGPSQLLQTILQIGVWDAILKHNRKEAAVHYGISCDGCGKFSIRGDRFVCKDCAPRRQYDLCASCWRMPFAKLLAAQRRDGNKEEEGEERHQHSALHRFIKLRRPASAKAVRALLARGSHAFNSEEGEEEEENEEEGTGAKQTERAPFWHKEFLKEIYQSNQQQHHRAKRTNFNHRKQHRSCWQKKRKRATAAIRGDGGSSFQESNNRKSARRGGK